MESRILLRSTRGNVAQEVEFLLAPVAGGYCVKSQHRIAGCHPRTGPCMLTPLNYNAAAIWAQAKASKLARSAAAFRPAKTVEDRIEELFFGQ